MGIVRENLLTKGFSGKIGDEIVFRQMGNRTYFAKRPRKRTQVTANQAAYHAKFKDAVLYARIVLLDPTVRGAYEQMARQANVRGAFNMALIDYIKDPVIDSIKTDGYGGEVGRALFITSEQYFKLTEVTVTIMQVNGSILETGPAMKDNNAWKYITATPNPSPAGCRIIVNAKDRIGKQTIFEKVIE